MRAIFLTWLVPQALLKNRTKRKLGKITGNQFLFRNCKNSIKWVLFKNIVERNHCTVCKTEKIFREITFWMWLYMNERKSWFHEKSWVQNSLIFTIAKTLIFWIQAFSRKITKRENIRFFHCVHTYSFQLANVKLGTFEDEVAEPRFFAVGWYWKSTSTYTTYTTTYTITISSCTPSSSSLVISVCG